MSVRDAVAKGDRRKALEALRDRLAGAIDEAADRDLAALSLRLVAVMDELGRSEAEGGSLDELAAKRAARRSDAKAV